MEQGEKEGRALYHIEKFTIDSLLGAPKVHRFIYIFGWSVVNDDGVHKNVLQHKVHLP